MIIISSRNITKKSCCISHSLPSDKRLHNELERSTLLCSWVNQLFRLGHVQVRKLFVYQRVNLHFPMVFLWFSHIFLWFSPIVLWFFHGELFPWPIFLWPPKLGSFWRNPGLLKKIPSHVKMSWMCSMGKWTLNSLYPLVNIQKTMENHQCQWVDPL